MNLLSTKTLRFLRKINLSVNRRNDSNQLDCESDPNSSSRLIYALLSSSKPCMIARFGSTELTCLYNYKGIIKNKKEYLKYIQGKAPAWWWEKGVKNTMIFNTGFFPNKNKYFNRFGELMYNEMSQVDILGSYGSKPEKDFY